MNPEQLEGRRILLVEDDFFQAREVKALLAQAGAEIVGPTGRAEEVPALLRGKRLDAALIDINLGTGPSYETAYMLRQARVPFAFITGYDQGAIPPDFAKVPCLSKPVRGWQVIELALMLLANADEGMSGT